MPPPPLLSIVVPMFNEEAVLPLFVERLRPVADGLGVDYEVLAVDDGSIDGTAIGLQRLLRQWPHLRVLRLRANAGHQAAISAGLAKARGDYVVTLDADLQDPPEVLAEKVDSVLFAGEEFTTIEIVLKDGDEMVVLRTGVRHEN